MKRTNDDFMHRFGEVPELCLEKHDTYSRCWQIVVLILAASYDRREVSKQGVIEKIKGDEWFNFIQDDFIPYPSAPGYTPRWETCFSSGYQICKKEGLMPRKSDDWHPTKEGSNFFQKVREYASKQILKLDECNLWSTRFKIFLNPEYQPSAGDAARSPIFAYRDSPKRLSLKVSKKIKERIRSDRAKQP